MSIIIPFLKGAVIKIPLLGGARVGYMEQSEALEYVKSLNARRKRKRMYGWGLTGLGVVTYLDAGWTFPIWLTGIWAFFLGTPLIIAGFILVNSTYKLPIREALLFANTQDGKVTVPSLSIALDITLETSDQILAYLVKRGDAQVSTEDMEEGAVVYKIGGIKQLSL